MARPGIELFDYEQVGHRISSIYSADPWLDPPLYGDIANAVAHGSMSEDEARIALLSLEQAGQINPHQRALAEDALRQTGLPSPTDRQAKKGFWTRVNEYLGTVAAMPAAPFRALGALSASGSLTDVGEELATHRERFSDQALTILDFTQHVHRAADLMAYSELADPNSPVTDYFSPAKWLHAWSQTRDGEKYFSQGGPPSNLPPLVTEIAKKKVGQLSIDDISVSLGVHTDVVEAVLAEPEVKEYMERLEDSKVSLGRTVRDLAGVDGTAGEVLSGFVDASVALLAEPDIAAGLIVKGVSTGARSINRLAAAAGSNWDALRNHRQISGFLNDVAKETSATAIKAKWDDRLQKIPVRFAEVLADEGDPDVIWEAFKLAATSGEITFTPVRRTLARAGNRLLILDPNELDPVRGSAVRLYRRLAHAARELPTNAPAIENPDEWFTHARNMMDVFPKAFSEERKRKVLDSVVRFANKQDVQGLNRTLIDIMEEGGKHLKVSPVQRKTMTRLYRNYLHAFFVHPQHGEQSFRMKSAAADAMKMAVPHYWSEGYSRIPALTYRDVRQLRWAQGSLSKWFVRHPTLGTMYSLPGTLTGLVWKPLVLLPRLAWPIRVTLDDWGRMTTTGRGPLQNPKKWFRAVRMQGEFAEWVSQPPTVNFWRHPFKYMSQLSDALDVEGVGRVAVGKSRIHRDFSSRSRSFFVESEFRDSDPISLRGWQYMLQQDYRDPIASRILKGESFDEVEDWLINGSGRRFHRDLAERFKWGTPEANLSPYRNVEEYIESIHERVTANVMGNVDLEKKMRGIANGQIPSDELFGERGLEFLDKLGNKPVHVKVDASLDRGPVGVLDRLTSGLFELFMDIPSTRLSRLPLFLDTVDESYRQSKELAELNGNFLPDGPLEYVEKQVTNPHKLQLSKQLERTMEGISEENVRDVMRELPDADFYHGTSHRWEGDMLAPRDKSSVFNLFGPGLYTTDSKKIAHGYAVHLMDEGGKTISDRVVYGLRWKGKSPPKFLDLEQPLPDRIRSEVADWVQATFEDFDYAVEDFDNIMRLAARSDVPGEELVQAVQRFAVESAELFGSRAFAEDLVDSFTELFARHGFDGFTHTGGRRTGHDPHVVRIFFHPERDLEISGMQSGSQNTDRLLELMGELRDKIRVAPDEVTIRELRDNTLQGKFHQQWRENLTARLDEITEEYNAAVASTPISGRDLNEIAYERARITKRLNSNKPTLSELDQLAGMNGFVTERMLRENAKGHGVNAVIALLYDPARRTKIQQSLATQFPFIAAWTEFITAWAWIMSTNPQNIGRAARLFRFFEAPAPEGHPFLETSPWGGKIIPSPVDAAVRALSGSGVRFGTELASLNLFTDQLGPGWGPIPQLGMIVGANLKPAWTKFISFLGGPFAVRFAEKEGIESVVHEWTSALFPSWLREARLSWQSPESDWAKWSRLLQEFNHLALTEYPDTDVLALPKDAVERLWEEAHDRSTKQTLWTAMARLVWPGNLIRDYPQRPIVEHLHALLKVMPEEEAFRKLEEDFGPNVYLLGESFSRASMPATKEAFEYFQSLGKRGKSLAREIGGPFWAMIEDQVTGDYDFNVFRWQLGQDIRDFSGAPYGTESPLSRGYAPGWVEQAEINKAWSIYDEARKEGEQLVAAGEIAEEHHRLVLRQVRAQLAADYPSWSLSQTQVTNKTKSLEVFHDHLKALATYFRGTDSGRGLRLFIQAFETAQQDLVSLGLQPYSLGAETARPVRAALNDTARKITELHPGFAPLYIRHLRFHLDEAADETPIFFALGDE